MKILLVVFVLLGCLGCTEEYMQQQREMQQKSEQEAIKVQMEEKPFKITTVDGVTLWRIRDTQINRHVYFSTPNPNVTILSE